MGKSRKVSVVDTPQFRSLDGGEARTVIVEKITIEFRKELERALDTTNNFFVGDTYPAVAVDGQLKVKVLPSSRDPAPFYVNAHFILGTTVDAAPDKLREEHGLPVLQPQKRPSGFIMNQPVKATDGEGSGEQASEPVETVTE